LKWELGLLAIVVLISMLPSANVFRWSFRWLPLVHVIVALCAAEAWRLIQPKKWWNPGTFGAVVLIALGTVMWFAQTAGPFGWKLFWFTLAIAVVWALLPRESRVLWPLTLVAFLATYLCIPPNCGVPKYNLDQRLTGPAPLDPQRLYLSVYPPVEETYRAENKPGAVGLVVRPGSTSMWGGVRLINGYSPIIPAGVGREFDCGIHGEIASWAADYFPEYEGGPDGKLAQIGVDGVIVAREIAIAPKPDDEWELVHDSDEGRVYHRRGSAFAPIRSADARIRLIEDSRNRAVARVEAPAGNSARVSFSRPYFRGYEARLDGKPLAVQPGLFPVVEVPAGTSGTLVLRYHPWFLVFGGAVAGLCACFWFVALAFAMRRPRAAGSHLTEV
jgi:hypothetical protein